MRKQMVPLALGLAAVAVAPLQTHAAEQSSDRDSVEAFQPVQLDSSAEVFEMTAQRSDLTQAEMPVGSAHPSATSNSSGILSFEPPAIHSAVSKAAQDNADAKIQPVPSQPIAQRQAQEAQKTASQPISRAKTASKGHIFEGGSESLVARTVGAAEGTRAADGSKTPNYYGHVDPGNGVWNRGTFSYQFGNTENLSPDEADRRQLAKIQRIHETIMLPKAEQHGIAPLTIAEEINGIDLINQAPLAVTEEGGYIERLADVKKKGLSGEEAILEARVQAFWDPEKGGWDAPGLRAYDDISKEESIRRDQERRMSMISKALDFYEQQNGQVAQAIPQPQNTESSLKTDSRPGTPSSQPENVVASVPVAETPMLANSSAIADAIIFNGM